MFDFLKDLPFSIEVWKSIAILLSVGIYYLSIVYKKYFILREETDKKIDDIVSDHNEIKELLSSIQIQLVENKKINDELLLTVDKFISIISTTEEIGDKQKQQLELLTKITHILQAKETCDLNVDEAKDLKSLIELIYHEYEIHKK